MKKVSYSSLSREAAAELYADLQKTYAEYVARGLRLDMSRGKPAPDQLDICEGLFTAISKNGDVADVSPDVRNYGGIDGIPEMKALFAEILGVSPSEVVIGGNAYKLSDVTEVKYPTVEVPDVDTDNKTETETQPEQEATEAVTGTETHPVEEEQFSPEDQALLDQLFEMLEQEQGDEQIDEDIQDLEDDIVTDEV